jgi:deoxyribonuclease IV
MKLGAHIGIGKGLHAAADRAHVTGCEALQIFTSNPRGWNFNLKSEAEITNFRDKIKEYQINYVFGHSIYLINIASINPYIYTNSINSLISGLVFAEKAKFNGVVTHVGSFKGSDFETGMKQIINALEQVLMTTGEKVPIILETDAGSGSRIGCRFSDIGQIIKSLKTDKIEVCLDTCHSFVSGYELRTKLGLEKTLAEFDKEIGLDKLALIHLNDSKGDLGSNLDRHEIIGEGYLGLDTFKNIINHPFLSKVPGIIETPDLKIQTGKIESLNRLKKIRKINS